MCYWVPPSHSHPPPLSALTDNYIPPPTYVQATAPDVQESSAIQPE